jgi:hypothetical protein
MKKSTKRLTISSEAKNANGFHVRTAGIELAEFLANPLLLWMHKRPKGEKDELLPLGYWEDVELKDGRITGVPVFDDTDDFAMKIYNKVENGTLKMASAGLKPNEFAQLAEEKWLEKSVLKEASIVDIGSNKECLAVALYNDSDELVTLAEIFTQKLHKPKNEDMKIILTAPTLGLLQLAEGATEEAANKAIENLVTLSETQKTTIQTLTDEKKAAEDKLAEQIKLADNQKVVALADQAITDRKITADQKDFIIGLAEKDFDGTKKYLESIKAAPKVKDSIDLGDPADELLKLTYDELDKANKLITLKEKNPEAFKTKFKEKFNKEYQG